MSAGDKEVSTLTPLVGWLKAFPGADMNFGRGLFWAEKRAISDRKRGRKNRRPEKSASYKGECAEIGLSLCFDRAEIVLRKGGAIREKGLRRGIRQFGNFDNSTICVVTNKTIAFQVTGLISSCVDQGQE
jgi:hypothetical protein